MIEIRNLVGCLISFFILSLSSCTQNTSDGYLRSLKLEPSLLAAADTVVIDEDLRR